MDVRCPQCHTLYELDQKQVGARSVSLKCSQCQHVFRFGGPSDGQGENQRRWMVRRKEQGDILYLNGFDTLHDWIMKRTVTDRDEISRTGRRWMRLRDVGEFQPLFAVVESIARLSGEMDAHSDVSSILTPRADTPLTMGVAPRHPDKRGRVRTQIQFGDKRPAPMRTEDVTKKVRPPAPESADTSSDFEARFKQHRREEREEPTKRTFKAPTPAPAPAPAPPAPQAQPLTASADSDEGFVLGSADLSHERSFAPPKKQSSGAGVWIIALTVVVAGGAGAYFVGQQQGWFAPVTPDVVAIGEPKTQPAEPAPDPVAMVSSATVAAIEAAHRENDAIWTFRYENASQPFYVALDTAYAAADQASVGVEIDQQLKQARSALENGKPDAAHRMYQEVLAESPSNATALAGVGWALLEQGRTQQAVSQFRKTIDTDSSHGDAYIGLGTAQRQLGKLQDAYNAYDLYLGRFPRGPKASIAAYQMKELKKQLGL